MQSTPIKDLNTCLCEWGKEIQKGREGEPGRAGKRNRERLERKMSNSSQTNGAGLFSKNKKAKKLSSIGILLARKKVETRACWMGGAEERTTRPQAVSVSAQDSWRQRTILF